MKIEAILRKKGTRIITVRANETVATAARLLARENIGALVVKEVCRTEHNTALGMFSERDVVRLLDEHGAAALAMSVAKFMTQTIVSCRPEDDVDHVLGLMDRHHIRHLPVFEHGQLIGVVSMRDLLTTAVAGREPPPAAEAGRPAVDAR